MLPSPLRIHARRLAAALSVPALLLTTFAAPGTASTTRTAPGPTVWTHNVAGNAKWRGSNKAVDPLIFAIASQSNIPVAIGVQEVCLNQAVRLLNWLRAHKSKHYRMAFRKQSTCRNGKDYGIAVYAIGNLKVTRGTFAGQHPRDGEKRGYVCMQSTLRYVACTAHLTFVGRDNGTYQRAQVKQMHDVVNSIRRAKKLPVYWGGDFYMTPPAMRSTLGRNFFRNHREGDVCQNGRYRPTVKNAGGTRKVDYVLKTAPATCSRDAVVHLSTSQSDHALLGGFL